MYYSIVLYIMNIQFQDKDLMLAQQLEYRKITYLGYKIRMSQNINLVLCNSQAQVIWPIVFHVSSTVDLFGTGSSCIHEEMCKLQNVLQQLIPKLYLVLGLYNEVMPKKYYRTSAEYQSYIQKAPFSYHNSKFDLVMQLNCGPGALYYNYSSVLVIK